MKMKERKSIRKPLSEIEYNEISDINAIKRTINYNVKRYTFRANFLIMLLLIYEAFFWVFKFNFSAFGVNFTPFYFFIFSVVIFMLALFTFFDLYYIGLSNILKLKIDPKSILFLSSSTMLCQLSLNLFLKQYTVSLPFVGLLILFAVLLEKKEAYIAKKVKQNFKFEVSQKEKIAIKVKRAQTTPKKLFKESSNEKDFKDIEKEKITANFNFFYNNLDFAFWEKIFSILAVFSVCVSFALATFSLILHKNMLYCLSCLSFLLIFSFPVLLPFSLYLKLYSFTKKAIKRGIMLFSYRCIKETASIKSITLTSKDLYPNGNVILREIKTFRGQRVDEAILYAAALTATTEGPLNNVFDKVILGQKKMLHNVSDPTYSDEEGLLGWVDGKRIMIGNRDLLKSYGITPPSRDYESKYRTDNKGISYIAVGYDLIAMFVLEYIPNNNLVKSLKDAEKNNIKINIKTSDSNIDKDRITRDFGLDIHSVGILPFKQASFPHEEPDIEKKIIFEAINNKDKVLDGIILSKQAYFSFKAIFGVQILAFLLALGIAFSLGVSGALDQLSEHEVFLFYLFWLIPSIFSIK
ncbi:MAG: hypothetical protein IJ758_03990 [Clostridia bacterium]|nr:hypothetical protein [Clostridia bacterium]